jgi:hypothetical protein
LACSLLAQYKYNEAEAEFRAILAVQQRVLGPEHRFVLGTCCNLASCLEAQGKKPEALVSAKRALAGYRKKLGEEHPDTKDAKKLVEILEKPQ